MGVSENVLHSTVYHRLMLSIFNHKAPNLESTIFTILSIFSWSWWNNRWKPDSQLKLSRNAWPPAWPPAPSTSSISRTALHEHAVPPAAPPPAFPPWAGEADANRVRIAGMTTMTGQDCALPPPCAPALVWAAEPFVAQDTKMWRDIVHLPPLLGLININQTLLLIHIESTVVKRSSLLFRTVFGLFLSNWHTKNTLPNVCYTIIENLMVRTRRYRCGLVPGSALSIFSGTSETTHPSPPHRKLPGSLCDGHTHN